MKVSFPWSQGRWFRSVPRPPSSDVFMLLGGSYSHPALCSVSPGFLPPSFAFLFPSVRSSHFISSATMFLLRLFSLDSVSGRMRPLPHILEESRPSPAARGSGSRGARTCAAATSAASRWPPPLAWPRSHSGKGRFPYSRDKNLFSSLEAGLVAQGGPPSRRVKLNTCTVPFPENSPVRPAQKAGMSARRCSDSLCCLLPLLPSSPGCCHALVSTHPPRFAAHRTRQGSPEPAQASRPAVQGPAPSGSSLLFCSCFFLLLSTCPNL